MATRRPDSLEAFQRKRAAKAAAPDTLPPVDHNIPGLPSLSHEEITYVEAAREALVTIKRTFEFWIVIARGLRTLKDKADRIGGRFTFDRLREREGLGGRDKQGKAILNKTRVSRLLAILERLPEVEAWRASDKLTDKQRFDWASPEAIFRHCPVFAKPEPEGRKPMTKAEQDRQALAVALEENYQLKQREDGDRFKPTDTAKDIASTIVGMFTPSKAESIFREGLALLKVRKTEKSAR